MVTPTPSTEHTGEHATESTPSTGESVQRILPIVDAPYSIVYMLLYSSISASRLGFSVNSFSQMGSHSSAPIGKLCRSAFSLILARSFWTGRDVSSAEVHELHESLARLPSPFELPVARKGEPDHADKALTASLTHLVFGHRYKERNDN
jgi:hypothetical protein